MSSVGLIIISDRASRGERADGCIPVFEEALASDQYQIVESTIVSDDPQNIKDALEGFISQDIQLIFTSGGTGCTNRDNTPEVTREIINKLTPGIDEAIRTFSCSKSKFAIYSRGISGITKNSLIINLPGSPKAVGEILGFLLPTLYHPLNLIAGKIADCKEDLSK